jgi:hypothetical protein
MCRSIEGVFLFGCVDFLGSSPPLSVGTQRRGLPLWLLFVTPKLSKELAVSVPEKVDLMVLVSSSASILSPIDHFVVLTRD